MKHLRALVISLFCGSAILFEAPIPAQVTPGPGRITIAQISDTHLGEKHSPDAADHLRKAVQAEPLYSAAWVTLGQLLVAQQKVTDGRDACSHAVAANANYLAGYLCLADISGREQKWDEMLKFSNRAVELDPTNDAVAYGLNAAANLNLHQLPAAEKSALKAIEIDKTHNDPRIYFLLAQIYESKGEPENEAAQLRQYLKFASDPNDAAMVKAYLADLEKRAGK